MAILFLIPGLSDGNMLKKSTIYGFFSGIVVTCLVSYNCMHSRQVMYKRRQRNGHQIQPDRKHTENPPAISRPRILCWIPTTPQNYGNRTLAVQETWGPDCDVTLFFSDVTDDTIPVIGLGIPEHRTNLAKKTMGALRYIYKHYRDKADWFLKADDDTYVIVENLRHFLSKKDPDAPYYYGSIFTIQNKTYNSGGAGYVMGRHVLDKIATSAHYKCANGGPEDMRVGLCLKALGVTPGKNTDEHGYEVFHWSDVDEFVLGKSSQSKWAPFFQPFWNSRNVASKRSATFHYIEPGEMRAFHFLLHNVSVYGYKNFNNATHP